MGKNLVSLLFAEFFFDFKRVANRSAESFSQFLRSKVLYPNTDTFVAVRNYNGTLVPALSSHSPCQIVKLNFHNPFKPLAPVLYIR